MDSIVDSMLDLFPDTVLVRRNTGELNSDQSPRYEDEVLVIPARVTGKVRRVTGVDGNEHVTSVEAHLAGTYDVSTDDLFTLPERFSRNRRDKADEIGRQLPAVAVDRATDENGPHHEKVYF